MFTPGNRGAVNGISWRFRTRVVHRRESWGASTCHRLHSKAWWYRRESWGASNSACAFHERFVWYTAGNRGASTHHFVLESEQRGTPPKSWGLNTVWIHCRARGTPPGIVGVNVRRVRPDTMWYTPGIVGRPTLASDVRPPCWYRRESWAVNENDRSLPVLVVHRRESWGASTNENWNASTGVVHPGNRGARPTVPDRLHSRA